MKRFEEVFAEELKAISAKRRKCNAADGFDDISNLFGVALSGGGIRSATVNLGVLNVINRCGILQLADYISTVSGGGYIGSYVHAKLRETGSNKESYKELFKEEDLVHIKGFGYYLAPGKGVKEYVNKLRLAGVFVFSLLMNWIWFFSLCAVIFFFAQGVIGCQKPLPWGPFGQLVCEASLATLAAHFFFHGLRHIRLWPSNILYYLEGILFFLALAYGISLATRWYPVCDPWRNFLAATIVLIFIGFFANPNMLTMHRFYRDRLADAYLKNIVKGGKRLKLAKLNPGSKAEDWGAAPYPLINTCLNLLGREDKAFAGTKTSDYFLLSPLYCGAELTGYIETTSPGYKRMSVPTAMAISGAAVNPNMGTRTNRVLAFFMTLLNLRLGYWAANPKARYGSVVSWWPYYHIIELLSKTNTKKWRVNISDGGHIENLGIYELLRRRCKLIIAIDASADPKYSFSDLSNLVVRARNELGIAVNFRKSLEPESLIKPLPSIGYSGSHFAIADLELLPRKDGNPEKYKGLLVYLKSSVKAPETLTTTTNESYLYKTYHPTFPHESTADQFFDEAQWKSHYSLGKFMAGDLLGVWVKDETTISQEKCGVRTIDELCDKFDRIKDKDGLEAHMSFYAQQTG
jgi:hypothetical protein